MITVVSYNCSETAKWYLVRCVSGSENTVIRQIKHKIDLQSESSPVVKSWFVDFFFPELIVKQVAGSTPKKSSSRVRSALPGYILVCMEMNDVSYNIIRTTEGVLGFMNMAKGSSKPTFLSEKDFNKMIEIAEKRNSNTESLVSFMPDDQVEITNKSLNGMKGRIKTIDKEAEMLKVVIMVFNKEVEVDVKFNEVKKIMV